MVSMFDGVIDAYDSIKLCPPVILYEGLCRLAAESCFSEGNEIDGAFFLSESHSVTLRLKGETCANYILRRTPTNDKEENLNPLTWKSIIGFDPQLSAARGRGLLDRIKDLPKEWTVIQVTSAFDVQFAVNPEAHEFSCPPRLYISRMECGENPIIVTSKVDFTPNSAFHYQKFIPKSSHVTKTFLEELRDIVADSKQVSSNGKGFKTARDYWEKREEHNQRMKMLLRSIESQWLRGWKCFFLGKLLNAEDISNLEDMVKRVLTSSSVSGDLPARSRAILSLLLGAMPNLEHAEIYVILRDAFPDASTKVIKELIKAIQDVKDSFSQSPGPHPCQWKRHPVILILDKRIEGIPWEMLPMLQEHPFSRVPAIHFAHFLSMDTSKEKEEAHIDASQGYYLVNPDGSLPDTEQRLLEYLERRPEIWTGKGGIEPSPEEFVKAVKDHNLVLYSGHGSGGKYLQTSLIRCESFRVVMLLMGCGSVSTKRLAAHLDPWGTVYQYMLARSRCIVGMLWEVTDVECDLVTMKLLDILLGPAPSTDKSKFPTRIPKRKKQNSECRQVDYGEITLARGNLLRAVKESRYAATQFMTSAAMVAYGIPVIASKATDMASLSIQINKMALR